MKKLNKSHEKTTGSVFAGMPAFWGMSKYSRYFIEGPEWAKFHAV